MLMFHGGWNGCSSTNHEAWRSCTVVSSYQDGFSRFLQIRLWGSMGGVQGEKPFGGSQAMTDDELCQVLMLAFTCVWIPNFHAAKKLDWSIKSSNHHRLGVELLFRNTLTSVSWIGIPTNHGHHDNYDVQSTERPVWADIITTLPPIICQFHPNPPFANDALGSLSATHTNSISFSLFSLAFSSTLTLIIIATVIPRFPLVIPYLLSLLSLLPLLPLLLQSYS